MADIYDLAYKSANEIPVNVVTSGDSLPFYDASTGGWSKMPASASVIAAGSALTMTEAAHEGNIVQLDTAAGSTVTLPASTGSGKTYRFYVSVLATTNSHIIKVANASDTMLGIVWCMADTSANAQAFAAVAGTSDTITLNKTTTGSVTIGEFIEITDVATNKFMVHGFTSSTGIAVTPFSATV